MLNKNKLHIETRRFGPQRQVSDSSFVSDSEGDEMPITKKTELKTLMKGAVHSRMENMPQNDLNLKHANPVTTVAMIHSPQDPPDPTLASKVDKKKPFRISNTKSRTIFLRNKQPSITKDCVVALTKNVELSKENQIDTRKEPRSENVLSRKRSSSESSLTSIMGSSDSDEPIIREKTDLPNLQEKRNIDFRTVKRKDHELVCSTPLHGKGVNFKTNNNWPSPIAVLSSRFNIVRKRNFRFKDVAFRKPELICSTPVPQRVVSQDQKVWQSRLPKKSRKLQNGNLNSNSDNIYPTTLRLQENSNSEQPVEFLQDEKELRLLSRRSRSNRASYLTSNGNKEAKIETVINKSVHTEDAENMKRLKPSLPDKINENVRKTRGKAGVTAQASTTDLIAIEVTKTAGRRSVRIRRKSPRNVQLSISPNDEEGVTASNSDKDAVRDKQNPPHKEQSSSRRSSSISGRKRLATSDDQMNNSKAGKEDDNKRRKASLNSGRKGEKNVAVPEDGDGLRRSARTRIKPVEYWRGERVKYKMGSDNLLQVVGVNPGRHHVNGDFDEKKKKSVKFAHLLNIGENPERKMIPVPFMGKEIKLECFSTLRFDSNLTEGPNKEVRVFTGLEVPEVEAGYIAIDPSSYIKDTSYDSIEFVFCIMTGVVSVTIHNTEQTLRKGEFFYVPTGVKYEIKNPSESEAVLFYTKIDK